MEGGWPLLALLDWMHPPPFLASLTSQEQSLSNYNIHGTT